MARTKKKKKTNRPSAARNSGFVPRAEAASSPAAASTTTAADDSTAGVNPDLVAAKFATAVAQRHYDQLRRLAVAGNRAAIASSRCSPPFIVDRAFYECCADGHVDLARQILNNLGGNWNVNGYGEPVFPPPDGTGRYLEPETMNWYSCIHAAVAGTHVEVIRLLVAQPEIQLNTSDGRGLTPLSIAAMEGKVEIAKLLIQQHPKCDINLQREGDNHWTALHYAVCFKQVEVVRLLLQHEQILVNRAGCCEKHESTWQRQSRASVAKGVPESTIIDTPLRVAAHLGLDNIVALLLKHPKTNPFGWMERENVKPAIRDMIMQAQQRSQGGPRQNPHNSVALRFATALQKLHWTTIKSLAVPANKAAIACFVDKAFCVACMEGKADVARQLVEQVDANFEGYEEPAEGPPPAPWFEQDNDGARYQQGVRWYSPLHGAVIGEHVEVVRYLSSLTELDINFADANGQTVLIKAAMEGLSTIVHALIQHPSCQVNFQAEPFQWTALHYAVRFENSKVVEVLLKHPDIKVNACARFLQEESLWERWSKLGAKLIASGGPTAILDTPLRVAAKLGYVKIVKLLLNHPKINPYGWMEHECPKTVIRNMILQAQANFENQQPKQIAKRFSNAVKASNWEVVKQLIAHENLQIIGSAAVDEAFLQACAHNQVYVAELLVGCMHANYNGYKVPIDYSPDTFSYDDDDVDGENERDQQAARHFDQHPGRHFSPLHTAVDRQHVEMVQCLVNYRDLDINYTDSKGQTALMKAVVSDAPVKIIKLLVGYPGCNVNCQGGHKNWSALHYAVCLSLRETAKVLLAQKTIDVNMDPRNLDFEDDSEEDDDEYSFADDDEICTPLCVAVHMGKIDMVKLLLHHPDIDPYLWLEKDCPPSQTAIRRLLFQAQDKYDARHPSRIRKKFACALRNLQWDIVKRLTVSKNKVHIGALADKAFYSACRYGLVQVATQLVEQLGANHNGYGESIDETGIVLHFHQRYQESVQWYSPLKVAVLREHLEVVRFLTLIPHLDINFRDAESFTALHKAVSSGMEEIVQLLIDHPNCDVNAQGGPDNWTPLHFAAFNNDDEIANLLLRHPSIMPNVAAASRNRGLSVSHHKTGEGKTPLTLAAKCRSAEVVKVLVNDPNVNPFAWNKGECSSQMIHNLIVEAQDKKDAKHMVDVVEGLPQPQVLGMIATSLKKIEADYVDSSELTVKFPKKGDQDAAVKIQTNLIAASLMKGVESYNKQYNSTALEMEEWICEALQQMTTMYEHRAKYWHRKRKALLLVERWLLQGTNGEEKKGMLVKNQRFPMHKKHTARPPQLPQQLRPPEQPRQSTQKPTAQPTNKGPSAAATLAFLDTLRKLDRFAQE